MDIQIGKCKCGKIDKLRKVTNGNWYLPSLWVCFSCYLDNLFKK